VITRHGQGGLLTSAEGVRSHSPRQEALDLAATELTSSWRADVPASAEEAERINRRYEARCRRLGIVHADVSLTVRPYLWEYANGRCYEPSCSPE